LHGTKHIMSEKYKYKYKTKHANINMKYLPINVGDLIFECLYAFNSNSTS